MNFEWSRMSSACLQIKTLRIEYSSNYFENTLGSYTIMISCINTHTIWPGKRRQKEVRKTVHKKREIQA